MSYPKLYHCYKLGFIWKELTNALVRDNQKQKIQNNYMSKVNDEYIVKKKVVEKKRLLGDAWELIQQSQEAEKAYFGTHLQLENVNPLKGTMRKIEPYYRSGSEYDLQRSYGFTLCGINEPMFFFKGDGAWTGLHAEDCGLASYNINIGPGTSRWTLINENQALKLSNAIKKKLKLKGNVDILVKKHRYYFNEDFLVENEIEYEVIDQEPGYSIYVPGYSMHQVKNSGYGLNVAWNVAVFKAEIITGMMAAYDFEVIKTNRIAMVPVLRIIHSLYFTYRSRLSKTQKDIFASYLKNTL